MKIRSVAHGVLACCAYALLGTTGPANADEASVADFYKGKTVKIVVPAPAGSTPDTISRMLAPKLAKFIPGNPIVIIDNKPGAASVLATNLVYNVEPKDGTVIGAFIESLLLQQAIGFNESFQFDANNFNWLGSGVPSIAACGVSTTLGISSLQDLAASKEPVVWGTIGPGSSGHTASVVLRDALGVNFKFVSGYDGPGRIILSFESGEVDGFCATFTNFMTIARHLIEGPNPKMKLLVIFGNNPLENDLVKGIPNITDQETDAVYAQLIDLLTASQDVGGSFWVSPEVPKDRVDALRNAMESAFFDPDVATQAAKIDYPFDPKGWEKTTELANRALNPPPSLVPMLREMYRAGQ